VPSHVAAATANALEKLPADRFESAAKFAEALNDPAFSGSGTRAVAATGAPAGRIWNRMSVAATVLAVLFLVTTIWGWMPSSSSPASTVHRQRIVLSSAFEGPGIVAFRTAIAPDGSAIAFIGSPSDGPGIWVKERARAEAVMIAGTEEATAIAFSQDGAWISYRTPGGLRKISRTGDVSMTVSDSGGGMGPNHAWLVDGSIVFTSEDYRRLYRVDAAGGELELLLDTFVDSMRVGLVAVQPVWGRNAVLIWAGSGVAQGIDQVLALDLETGEESQLLDGVGAAWSLPSGHLIYGRQDGAVFVAPFDASRLELTGPGLPLAEGLTSLYGIRHHRAGVVGPTG
jgi:serine/threonine-protein kinase